MRIRDIQRKWEHLKHAQPNHPEDDPIDCEEAALRFAAGHFDELLAMALKFRTLLEVTQLSDKELFVQLWTKDSLSLAINNVLADKAEQPEGFNIVASDAMSEGEAMLVSKKPDGSYSAAKMTGIGDADQSGEEG